MIRRPPRSTPLYSSAASDVYKRQGVIPRAAEDLKPSVLRHPDQVGMGAADDQPEQRGLEIGPRQHGRIDVSPEVVDSREWSRPCGRKTLPHSYPHQQAAGKARAAGDRAQIDVNWSRMRAFQRQVEQLRDCLLYTSPSPRD